MPKLNVLQEYLRPGKVYRRSELAKWSNAVDRHLKELQEKEVLMKLAAGLYYCPEQTAFGAVPADDKILVQAFLKDKRFLLTTPNNYNVLGVGTTQLYNATVVYNHKRHGCFTLGGRTFDFRMKPHFPLKLSEEFLVVDLVDNLEKLAEDKDNVLERVKKKLTSFNQKSLQKMVRDYGGAKAKKFFASIIENGIGKHAS